jgi:hypothetical protein
VREFAAAIAIVLATTAFTNGLIGNSGSRKRRATHRDSRDRPRFCPSIFVSSEE